MEITLFACILQIVHSILVLISAAKSLEIATCSELACLCYLICTETRALRMHGYFSVHPDFLHINITDQCAKDCKMTALL